LCTYDNLLSAQCDAQHTHVAVIPRPGLSDFKGHYS
jgi:hypothetical protein